MQLVISAFPGCGKSTICKNAETMGLKQCFVHKDEHTREYEITEAAGPGVPVFDSDSSVFDKAEFPQNYIKHIKEVLEKYPDVIVMVSSHDNVREAMAKAGIPFTLVYPQRELKGDYLGRYEQRGSSAQFVDMMDNKWNDFIDSAENDSTPNHVVLPEGKYLIDQVYDQINQVVTEATGESIPKVDGFENMNDGYWEKLPKSEIIPGFAVAVDVIANTTPISPPPGVEVTAAIVDINADANNPDGIQPEPTGGIEIGVVSVPEGEVTATLEGGPFIGTQPAVDASTVDNSALTGNEDLELAEMKLQWAEQDRSELNEAKLNINDDIEILEEVLVHCSEPDRGGLETLQDGGAVFQAAASDIKERYDVDVEPTLAGMESFLTSLKSAIGKITEKLKKQPSKQELAVIKKFLNEFDTAAKLYAEPAWQDKQEFKNVGKAKFSMPAALASATTPDSVKTILNGFLTIVDKEHAAYVTNAKQRMADGLKLFNKYRTKAVPDDWGPVKAEINKSLPLKPEKKAPPAKDVFKAVLDISKVNGEVPVLKKDNIKEIVDILQDLSKRADKYEENTLNLAMTGVSYSDIYDSNFWDKAPDDLVSGMAAGAEWENATDSLDTLEDIYTDKIFEIAKFLEQWILNSVK